MELISKTFRRIRELCEPSYSYARLGNERHKCIFVDYGNGHGSVNIACNDVLLGSYLASAGTTVDQELLRMIECANKKHQPQAADFNGKVIVVGPSSSLEEGMALYRSCHKSLDEAWSAYTGMSSDVGRRVEQRQRADFGGGPSI